MGGKSPEVQQITPTIPEESKEEALLKKILTAYGVSRSRATQGIMDAGDRVFSGQGSGNWGNMRSSTLPPGLSRPHGTGGGVSGAAGYEDFYDDLFPTTTPTTPVYQAIPEEERETRGGGGDGVGYGRGPAPRGLFTTTEDLVRSIPGFGDLVAGYVPSRAVEMAATWNGRGYSPGAMRDIYDNYGPTTARRGLTAEWKAIQDAARERSGGRYGNMSEGRSRDLDRDNDRNERDQKERGSGYDHDSRGIPH